MKEAQPCLVRPELGQRTGKKAERGLLPLRLGDWIVVLQRLEHF